LAKSRAYGRSRVCGTCGNLQFDLSYDFFSHI
jgi:hypothetical protein